MNNYFNYCFKSNKPFGLLVPEIGHLHSNHDTSNVCANGRYCAKEVVMMVEWLLNNILYIRTIYNKHKFWKKKSTHDIEKTIVVVTFFPAQKELIKFALNATAEMFQRPELAVIPCFTADEFVARNDNYDIVLLSTIYGAYDNWDYIRDNSGIVNDVFSQAKDYCFIFGEQNDPRRIWRESKAIEDFRNRIYLTIPDMLKYPGPEAIMHEDEKLFIRDMLIYRMINAGYDVIARFDKRMTSGSLGYQKKDPDGDSLFEIWL